MTQEKPVEHTNENLQSFLEIRHVEKEVLPSHKLQDQIVYDVSFTFSKYTCRIS